MTIDQQALRTDDVPRHVQAGVHWRNESRFRKPPRKASSWENALDVEMVAAMAPYATIDPRPDRDRIRRGLFADGISYIVNQSTAPAHAVTVSYGTLRARRRRRRCR